MSHETSETVYDNCSLYHPDGTMMCWCGRKRMNWYLRKGLAERIDDNSVKLIFEPGGKGHSDDEYYLEQRANQCVVCGTETDLTKHHVVPHQYRKHMDGERKNHTHYDVLCVCASCHAAYEEQAMKLNLQLSKSCEVPINQTVSEDDLRAKKITSYIQCLQKNWKKIPEERIEVMLDMIGSYFGYSVSLDDLEDLVIEFDGVTSSSPPAKRILDKWKESHTIQEFVVMWRQHFLDHTNPKFLSELWLKEYKTREY